MKSRYIRVSSSSQNNARQLAKQHADEKLFLDVVSGSVPFKDRPAGKELINAIEGGEVDYLSVESIDRLGRDAYDIQTTIQYLNQKLVNIKVENLGIESLVNGEINLSFKMITDVLANVAEMTRQNILESQRQGIAVAKAQGKYKGRVKGSGMTDDEFLAKYPKVVKEIKLGVNSIRKIATLCDVGQDTVLKVKKIADIKINKHS